MSADNKSFVRALNKNSSYHKRYKLNSEKLQPYISLYDRNDKYDPINYNFGEEALLFVKLTMSLSFNIINLPLHNAKTKNKVYTFLKRVNNHS
jgi:hypothetical protein